MLAGLNQVINNGAQISAQADKNKTKLVSGLMLEVSNLCNWFKTVRGIEDENELLHVVEIIIDNFWYLKFEEIQFCFKRVKSGKTNIRVLDRLDGSTIVSFIDEYDSGTRALWCITKANIYRSLEKQKGVVENDDFDKEKFYSEGKKYFDEQNQKKKKVSIGTPKPTDEQRRRQYELILPDLTPSEVNKMLKQAEKDNNILLIETINKLNK